MQIDYSKIGLNKIRWERNGEWREADIDDLIECYEKEHYHTTMDIIKKIMADQFPYAERGLYLDESLIDAVFLLYENEKEKIQFWICPMYEYFLIIGLSTEQKKEICEYYHSLKTKEVGYVQPKTR